MNRFPFSVSAGEVDNEPVAELDDDLARTSSHHLAAPCSFAPARGSRHHIFVPMGYSPGYDYPLLVWLHSNGNDETEITRAMAYISLRNYIGLGIRGNRSANPGATQFDWHDSAAATSASTESIMQSIESVESQFAVHPSRIVIAGYGQGGTMALRVAMQNPARFAAAISLGGRMPHSALRDFHSLRQRRLPMLWQWAEANPQYTTESISKDCRLAMSIGSRVEIRQYPGTDELGSVVFSDLNDWIMRTVVLDEPAANEYADTIPIQQSAN